MRKGDDKYNSKKTQPVSSFKNPKTLKKKGRGHPLKIVCKLYGLTCSFHKGNETILLR